MKQATNINKTTMNPPTASLFLSSLRSDNFHKEDLAGTFKGKADSGAFLVTDDEEIVMFIAPLLQTDTRIGDVIEHIGQQRSNDGQDGDEHGKAHQQRIIPQGEGLHI